MLNAYKLYWFKEGMGNFNERDKRKKWLGLVQILGIFYH